MFRIVLNLLCSLPLLAALVMLHRTYRQSIPFRKPEADRLDAIRRRSLWIFNSANYEIAGYDIVDRMRVLLVAIFVGWAIFFVALTAF